MNFRKNMKNTALIAAAGIIMMFSNVRAEGVKVTNVHYVPGAGNIEILYDLEGASDSEYDVKFRLRKEGVPSFIFSPTHLSGDAGKGKFAGKERKIIWDVNKDYHIDSELSGYFLEVTADLVSSSIPWYYYAGGAIISGAAAYLIFNKKDSAEEKTIQVPPDRPGY
jgi:hypothetical protein